MLWFISSTFSVIMNLDVPAVVAAAVVTATVVAAAVVAAAAVAAEDEVQALVTALHLYGPHRVFRMPHLPLH